MGHVAALIDNVRVVALAAAQDVDATLAVEHVRRAVADQRVVQLVAGAVEGPSCPSASGFRRSPRACS